jgi:hemoglobin/transferrin/lactoferrin receptor protein
MRSAPSSAPLRAQALAWSFAATCALRLGAQETGSAERRPLELPAVVVTPTRSESGVPADTLPYLTRSLDESSIRARSAPSTLPDALDEVPGVSVQKTGNGLDSPYLRGFTGFRTLLLIDGIRLNNAVFRDGPNQYWSTVDPLAFERIEAVMGPSSTLYGSDAIGGAVNLLTVDPREDGHHPRLYYRYASAEDSHTTRAEGRGRESLGDWGTLGYAAGVTWRDFGDLSGGRHTGAQENTGYDALAGDAKAVWRLSDRLELSAAHQSWDGNRIPRTHATADGISYRGTGIGSDRRRDFFQDRHLSYVRAEAAFDEAWIEALTVTASYQAQRETEDRIRSSFRRTLQSFDDRTLGVSIVGTSPETAAGVWTIGAEHFHDWVDSDGHDILANGMRVPAPRGVVADDAQYGLLGVFIQDHWRPLEWFEVIAGGRYNLGLALADHADIDPNPADAQTFEDLDERFESLVGSGRAIFHPLEWLSPFAGVSQGFRAPNLSDLTRFDIARSGDLEVPNTALRPEKYVTAELGAHLHGKSWRASAAYFYTWIDDMIIRSPTGTFDASGNRIVRKDNVGDGSVNGVELAAEWDFLQRDGFGILTAVAHGTWMEGRVESFNPQDEKVDRSLDKMEPAWLVLALRWTEPQRRAWLELHLRKTFEQDQLSPGDQSDSQRIPPEGTPGYYLLGLRGSWRPWEALELFAGVENSTDRDYRVHGSGVNGPGTSVIAGAELRW